MQQRGSGRGLEKSLLALIDIGIGIGIVGIDIDTENP